MVLVLVDPPTSAHVTCCPECRATRARPETSGPHCPALRPQTCHSTAHLRLLIYKRGRMTFNIFKKMKLVIAVRAQCALCSNCSSQAV